MGRVVVVRIRGDMRIREGRLAGVEFVAVG